MYLSFLSTLSNVWGKAWPIMFAILFFGIIIMVHELGHFLFAKIFKVRVNKFALGMGPALLKKTKGETTYSLRLLPIGGYCAMEGEDEDSDDERSFGSKPVWQRFIIVAAGAVINLILGLIIVMVMLGQQDLIGTPYIRDFHENSATQAAGLSQGDKIMTINGKRVYSQFDVGFLMMRAQDGVLDFGLKRDGEKIALNNVELETVEKDGHTLIIYDFIIKGVKPSLGSVLKYSFLETVSMGRMVWISLFDLVSGQFGFTDISGPIGVVGFIAQAAEETKMADLSNILSLMALISINIGIFNLLPIPALDGGRLFFMFIEMIFRKPVPRKYESWIHATGLILLLAFMAAISLKDILFMFRR
ncbi:MAG TPA: M50 family metallopeptidase [Clostridia bacterium]|nr:M50 family metallopeptidase [Clostridia bacterium]